MARWLYECKHCVGSDSTGQPVLDKGCLESYREAAHNAGRMGRASSAGGVGSDRVGRRLNVQILHGHHHRNSQGIKTRRCASRVYCIAQTGSAELAVAPVEHPVHDSRAFDHAVFAMDEFRHALLEISACEHSGMLFVHVGFSACEHGFLFQLLNMLYTIRERLIMLYLQLMSLDMLELKFNHVNMPECFSCMWFFQRESMASSSTC